MPPKQKVPADDAAPQVSDPLAQTASELCGWYGELNEAMARGDWKQLNEPCSTRKWAVATSRDEELTSANSTSAGGPGQYADWVRRFGFSFEREIDFNAALENTRASKARHLTHLKAAADVDHDNSMPAHDGPMVPRPAAFPYAVAKDQVDTIMSMVPADHAGDAFALVKRTNYDAVDFHALVNVGACHVQTVGGKPEDEQARWNLADVVSALVAPYQTTSWRLSALDCAHFKVRAIARWIAAFVRVVSPPLGPPLANVNQQAPTTAPSAAAQPKNKAAPATDSLHLPVGRAFSESPINVWLPYRGDDNDPDDENYLHGQCIDDATPTTPSINALRSTGEATALAVFATRVGDPHQVAVLFTYMCRHQAAGLVFTSQRQAAASASGRLPAETCEDVSYSALSSQRKTVAQPTGAGAAYVAGLLHDNPRDTLSHTIADTKPCHVRTVRGTLKGTIDPSGKPIGYLPWSWNLVTLPDGKDYLLDVALCAANVPLKFLVLHHQSCIAVKAGELGPSEHMAPGSGKETKGLKAVPSSVAVATSQLASTAEAISAALVASYGNYSPLAGHLQHHVASTLRQVGARMSSFDGPSARGNEASGEPGNVAATAGASASVGTRGYLKAPLLPDTAVSSPSVLRTIVACTEADVPSIHALGAWTEQQLPTAGPYGVVQLSTLLARTCFEAAYFFADPRHFAQLHYPNNQDFLLLQPPSPGSQAESSSGTKSGTSGPVRRLITRAQWEAYPRLTHAATTMGFALESHARRAAISAKGCPQYLSFILGTPASVEVVIKVYKASHSQLILQQSSVTLPVPVEGQTAELYAGAADAHMAATQRSVEDKYRVICLKGAIAKDSTVASPAPDLTPISIVDPTYFTQSREEIHRRTVVSLMFPDVGQYTISIGARRLNTDGQPLSQSFFPMTSYQCSVSFVPTNEGLLPLIREPPTVCKLIAPSTSRIAAGTVYFAVAPTNPSVVSVAIVNDVAPKTLRAAKEERGAQSREDPSMIDESQRGAAQTMTIVEKTVPGSRQTFFLAWDANTATFNGTCRVDVGSVEVWLGIKRSVTGAAESMESVVPAHLLPPSTSPAVANMVAMLNKHSGDCGGALPRSTFGLLQKLNAVPRPGVGIVQPLLTATMLTASWRPEQTAVPGCDSEKPTAKGKAKDKERKANIVAVPSPTPPQKPNPTADFVPFVQCVQVSRRIASKEAAILTNNFSTGATQAPETVEDLVPPPSLMYTPPTTTGEQRVVHSILAKTVADAESCALVASLRADGVGSAFAPR
jgi:hypothetical protein